MENRQLIEMLKNSKYTVVLSGFGMLLESGYIAIRDGEESYDIEQKYGYSVEELLHASMFATRTELFYEFYKDVILPQVDTPPGKCFTELAKLEKMGIVDQVITRRIFNLPERAGCEHVINLHGQVYDNSCTHCGAKYDLEFVRDSKKAPVCPKCQHVIRPDIILYGEMVDNAVITEAAKEVEKADVLLVLGTNLNTPLCTLLTGYYKGDKMIVITPEEHFSNNAANYVMKEKVTEALTVIGEELIRLEK